MAAYWAYAFESDRSVEDLASALESAGSWKFGLRDSHWYGDYLNSRPAEGVRVRIHQWREPEFTVLLHIAPQSAAEKAEIDAEIKRLLAQCGARNVLESEPYD